MSFNPFENEEQPRRKGGKMGGNFVENLGGDYIHAEGNVFNLQSDPLGQDTPRRTPPPRHTADNGHRTINLNGGAYHAYIDGDYVQGQQVNIPDDDVIDVNATPVSEDDDDAW
ncbi:hypothetical protein H6F90_11845 [Trichocoleus sp. FACHB-591]|uniref:hypothetical protein n=1 Tax=Trichocoleus sp. FACHB-591 TaxID=2692872 RepID=UPI001682BB6F|nr:hypothetical protein [Trichocoleus sp. FACHB-591]MBD2095841.1 hypothetical protein [Trichocoleus sp. FACHB-591]